MLRSLGHVQSPVLNLALYHREYTHSLQKSIRLVLELSLKNQPITMLSVRQSQSSLFRMFWLIRWQVSPRLL